jgi:hypothetical protein
MQGLWSMVTKGGSNMNNLTRIIKLLVKYGLPGYRLTRISPRAQYYKEWRRKQYEKKKANQG